MTLVGTGDAHQEEPWKGIDMKFLQIEHQVLPDLCQVLGPQQRQQQ